MALLGILGMLIAGIAAVLTIPVRILPDIERPEIYIYTDWPGATSEEVESELLEPQEWALRSVTGVQELRAWANTGSSSVQLVFAPGTDINLKAIETVGQLTRLTSLPPDARPPIIRLGGSQEFDAAVVSFVVYRTEGAELGPHVDLFHDVVVPRLRSVRGVSHVDLAAGIPGEREIRVEVDPGRAAHAGVSLLEVAARIGALRDVTVGTVDVGRRSYPLRYEARYTADELSQLIVAWRDGRPVRIGDIGSVRQDNKRQLGFAYWNGKPGVLVRVHRDVAADAVAVARGVRAALAVMARQDLARQGLATVITHDASVYVGRSIALVLSSLAAGIAMTMIVVALFMRRWAPTLVVALAVPVSLLGSVIALNLLGHSLNLVSLAGLGLACGVLVDVPIVVADHVLRRQAGLPAVAVRRPLVIGTVTTLVVFAPILVMPDVEGRILTDLALSFAVGAGVSLVYGLWAVPALLAPWAGTAGVPEGEAVRSDAGGWLAKPWLRWAAVASVLVLPVLAWQAAPSLTYLPALTRDTVDAGVFLPAGTAIAVTRDEVASTVIDRLQRLTRDPEGSKIAWYLVTGWSSGLQISVAPRHASDADAVEALLRSAVLSGIPDALVTASRPNMLGVTGADGTVTINLRGEDIRAQAAAAADLVQRIRSAIPAVDVWTDPPLAFSQTQMILRPRDRALEEAGLDRAAMAGLSRIFGDGLWLGRQLEDARRRDLVLKAQGCSSLDACLLLPLATPLGGVVPMGRFVTIEQAAVLPRIKRVDGLRTFSVNVRPRPTVPVAALLSDLERLVAPAAPGVVPEGGAIALDGSAGRLRAALNQTALGLMVGVGLLAASLAIWYRSLLSCAVILLAVPFSLSFGLAALLAAGLLRAQPLDMITLLGFIAAAGLAVNSVILLVESFREQQHAHHGPAVAAWRAGATRRPAVVITTVTSVAGMLPLIIAPGYGSAVYSGLAAAIAGSVAGSALYALIVAPALLAVDWPGLLRRPRRLQRPRRTPEVEGISA